MITLKITSTGTRCVHPTMLLFSNKNQAFRCTLVLIIHWSASVACSQSTVDYTKQIKPILKTRCYACHGGLKQEAGLRLDTGKTIRLGGDSGSVVVAAKADESLLIERVLTGDDSARMPPDGEPLTSEQVELMRRWIRQGAESPENEEPEANPRDHWSFRALQRPAVPGSRPVRSVQVSVDLPRQPIIERVGNPIDVFINGQLAAHHLMPQSHAPKQIQLRRVYLDLIGVPPTRTELNRFLHSNSDHAYEQVVDRLLNDPRYGERWGRHWMDVWRYSDWYGRRNVPDVWNSAPQVWRWRDWIVRSLNEDKGYDQMLREMLAADEIMPEDSHATVATGYLIRNWYALNPNDWMRNTVEHTGKAFLGLTFNCAHCHDHKYDPISQEDYFRLRAFFEPMYVRQDRVRGEADPGPFQDYEYSTLRKIQRLGAVRVFDKTPDAPTWFYTDGDERNRVKQRGTIRPGVPSFLSENGREVKPVNLPVRGWYPGFDPEMQAAVLADARQKLEWSKSKYDQLSELLLAGAHNDPPEDANVVSARQKSLEARLASARAELASVEARIAADRAKYGERVDADSDVLTRTASELERKAKLCKFEAELMAKKYALVCAQSLSADDEKRPKQIALAQDQLAVAEQEFAQAGEDSPRDMTWTYTPISEVYPRTSTGRRRALADWIADRDNPLTARVAVNHIWMRHFHQPLVATVYDFGRNGAEPTHPKLLDWLAVELIEAGWSMKHLHRLIVTSDTYRRSSNVSVDSTWDNGISKNAPMEVDPNNRLLWRMNSGRMESEVLRDSLLHCSGILDATIGGQPLENDQAFNTYRRSLYYEVFPEDGGANQLSTLFDAPNPLECYRRTRSIVPQQALALTNSELVHQVSEEIVGAWQQQNPNSSREQLIVDLFEQILSKTPTPEEKQLCIAAINQQIEIRSFEAAGEASIPKIQTAAYQSLVRSLLNHNEFVTIR